MRVQSEKMMIVAATSAANEPSRSAQHVQVRGPQVQILRIASSQQHQRDDVDEQTTAGDCKHQRAHHWRRISQPHNRFIDDPRHREQQQYAVDECGEDLQPLVTIGSAAIRGPRRETQGHPGESQRCGVGEHVPGVGQQCQRTGEKATDDFNDREPAREHERPHEAVAVLGVIVGVSMFRVAMITPRRGLYVRRRALHSTSIPVYYAASQ